MNGRGCAKSCDRNAVVIVAKLLVANDKIVFVDFVRIQRYVPKSDRAVKMAHSK